MEFVPLLPLTDSVGFSSVVVVCVCLYRPETLIAPVMFLTNTMGVTVALMYTHFSYRCQRQQHKF